MSKVQKKLTADLVDLDNIITTQNNIALQDEDGRYKSQTTLLIEIGNQGNLFHDEGNEAYSEIIRDGINITMKIRSKEFVEYLSSELYNLTSKGANNSAITDAKNTLEAKAKFRGECIECAVRAHKSEKIYIDLGCDKRRVIEVSDTDWKIIDSSEVKFIRKNGMTTLPNPTIKGDISLLKKYLNINESDFPLIVGWMLCALGGVKPYPILIFQGEQGTGKSTNTRVIRALTDPSSVPLRTPPKDTQNLLVSAANNHVVAIDNISNLKAEISDCLCRLSTGGGIDMRALYTDDEQYLVDIQKPIIINGIDDIASRPDLSERSIILNLPLIPNSQRLTEIELRDSFDKDKPKIFTGLLNALVSGLKNFSSTILPEKPRMADVAQWVTACEEDVELKYQFINAHKNNQLTAVEASIEVNPVGMAIKQLMQSREKWIGTPTQLFNTLSKIVGYKVSNFPQTLKSLNNIIKRLTPNLRIIGIEIIKKTTHNREYILETRALYPPQAPQLNNGKTQSPVEVDKG